MQNNECIYICEQFTEYHENSLLPELKAKVDAHLTVCSPCQAIYQELAQVIQKLHSLPTINTNPEFNDQLLSKLRDLQAESTWSRIYKSSYMRVASYAVAAGFIVAVGLNVWIDPISPINQGRVSSFAGTQKPNAINEETLASQTDSVVGNSSDSLELSPGTISSGSSTLQLVNDTQ